VTVDLPGSRSNIELVADGKGNWSRDGRFLPGLDGAMEPDISVTPFTNSFPVRRLGLRKGESADIRTAYIDAVDGKLFADPQRYTCLEEGRRYLHQSLDSDFCREITFDPDGFVSSYPGLFRRIA
jgi:hypothetical protein